MPALNLDYRTATRTLDWKKLAKIQDPRDLVSTHDFVTTEPRLTWLDGIPLGNGDMAAMFYGTPNRLTWLLNKSDVWDHRVPGNGSNLPSVPFRQIASWVEEKDWKSIAKVEERGKNLTPRHYPSIQPAAWIVLEPIGEGPYKGFNQVHSLLTGEVTTEFLSDFLSSPLSLSKYKVQTFLAADQNVLRIRIESDHPLGTVRARLLREPAQHLPGPVFHHRGTLLQLQYSFPDNLNYVVGLESDIPSRLATQDTAEASIVFDDVEDNFLELRAVIACSHTTSSPEERVRATLNVEKPQRYRGAIRRNQQAMEKFWVRSGFAWPDKPEIEKMWYLSQYLLGATAAVGKQASGLQGLWNGHSFPPWNACYRTDLHLQMNYWGAFTSNRLDMVEPYIRLFALEVRDQMRSDTAHHWAWGGIKTPLCFGPRGQELSTWLPAKLWPGGTAWVALDFLRFWEYSSDSVYLTTIGYNFALECVEFIENWLFRNGTDRPELSPSFCPNLGKGSPDVWAEESTCDIALFRALFTKMLEVSNHPEIREDPSRVERWQFILDHLPDYPNQNGRWADARNVEWKQAHRYLSKMMPVYPLDEVSLSSPKSEIQTANLTLKSLEQKGVERTVGFTLIWLAAVQARLGNFQKSIQVLEEYMDRFTRPNGLNRHYRDDSEDPAEIFQADANLAFTGAVNELFLQWTDGVVRVFPGMGRSSTARFWGWRTPGGHLVAALMAKGKIEGLVIEATRSGKLRLVSPFPQTRLTYRIRLKSKVESKSIANKRGKIIEIDLRPGERFEVGKISVPAPRKIT